MLEVEILKFELSIKKAKEIRDYVAQEKPCHIYLNRRHYATINCTPANLKELAVGHVLSEGIVESAQEIKEIILENRVAASKVTLMTDADLERKMQMLKRFSRMTLSSCGGAETYQPLRRLRKIKSDLKVKAETILNCVGNLNSTAKIFRKTGGVHAAAIYDCDGALVAFAEDVGRHNAVDKVIGIAVSRHVDFERCFLALTGRLSGDIVFKAARSRLPIMASLAAALDSGISIAKKVDLTLIGFARGKRMNIYNFPGRILL
jgi:FdhD protein